MLPEHTFSVSLDHTSIPLLLTFDNALGLVWPDCTLSRIAWPLEAWEHTKTTGR
jgi:hypothetical protein